MSKWLRILCIGMTFVTAGFFFYKTTDDRTVINLIWSCVWFIMGVRQCKILYETAELDGKVEIMEIVNEVMEKAYEEVRQKIKELEESEGEDES